MSGTNNSLNRPLLAVAPMIVALAALVGIVGATAQTSGRQVDLDVILTGGDTPIAPGAQVDFQVSLNGVDVATAILVELEVQLPTGVSAVADGTWSCAPTGTGSICIHDDPAKAFGTPTLLTLNFAAGLTDSELLIEARGSVDVTTGTDVAIDRNIVRVTTLPDLAVDFFGANTSTVDVSNLAGPTVERPVIFAAFRPGSRLPESDGWSCAMDLAGTGVCRRELGPLAAGERSLIDLSVGASGPDRVVQVAVFDGVQDALDLNPANNVVTAGA